MRKIGFFSLAATLLLITSCGGGGGGSSSGSNNSTNWTVTEIVSTPAVSTDTYAISEIAATVGPDDEIHATYLDSPDNWSLKHATDAGGTWTITKLREGGFTTSGVGVNEAGDAFALYNSGSLYFAGNTGGTFSEETVRTNTWGMNDTAYFLKGSEAHGVICNTYSTNRSGAWVHENTGAGFGVGGGLVGGMSLKVADDGSVHLAAFDKETKKLVYLKRDNTGWSAPETIDSNADLDALDDVRHTHTSMALGADGKIHLAVSYVRPATSDMGIYYYSRTGGTWTKTLLDSALNIGAANSLALDGEGKVHITYRGGSFDLKYATNETGSWKTSTVYSEGDSGVSSALVIDSQGRLHVVFSSIAHGEAVKLMHAVAD